ncbi:5-formyltetrahydrofolate cyclo-ligase [Spirochaetia bacterium]|nr:5-formyltetrahydrofolate cyclo-ligase [Spirochaetia bacterium]
MKARLVSFPPEQFHIEGIKAAVLIQALPVWSQYTNILLFLSMKYEIDTQPLLEAAFAASKKLFAPRVEEDNLAFCRIHSPDGPWHYGPYGIREPTGLSSTDFPALVIVPGLAFDRSGMRLGRGGGYYDRFLAALNAAGQEYAALGLCMAAQIVPEVPAEEFDKKMSGICTAMEFIRIEGSNTSPLGAGYVD